MFQAEFVGFIIILTYQTNKYTPIKYVLSYYYYLPTCLDHHHGAIRKYKQYTNLYIVCILL